MDGVTFSNVTQLRTLKNVKETDNYTLANIEKQANASTLPTVQCNSQKPLFNGKICISCDQDAIYDLKAANCIPPQLYTNTTALKNASYLESDNTTLASLDAAAAKLPAPKKACPSATPLFTGKECIACPNALYNLTNGTCVSCTKEQQYNASSHRCGPKPNYYPNLTNSNWIVADASGVGKVLNLTKTRKALNNSEACPEGA